MDVTPIFIIDIAIEKEEVRELECFNKSSYFDILIGGLECKLVLKSALIIK